MLSLLAEGYWKAGMVEEGLAAISDALASVEEKRERWWEADLNRLQAELLLQQDKPDASEAEVFLQQALTVAREQGAKSLELRAATSLGRLWYQQGKREQAFRLVEDIYSWFTEGFDTADLQNAKALRDKLAR
jgi:predicted ATPase